MNKHAKEQKCSWLGKRHTRILLLELSSIVDYFYSFHMMVRDNRFTQTSRHTQTHIWVTVRKSHHELKAQTWDTHSHSIRTAEGLSQRDLRWHKYTKYIKAQTNALKYTLLPRCTAGGSTAALHKVPEGYVAAIYAHLQTPSTSWWVTYFLIYNLFKVIFCMFYLRTNTEDARVRGMAT